MDACKRPAAGLMPAKASWLLRIPEILRLLSEMQAPVIDRATCERLFGIRRRRAIDLLQRFGGYTAGNTVLVDRTALIRHLDGLRKHPDVAQETARRERLSSEIDRLHQHATAAAVMIQCPEKIAQGRAWAAPAGATFLPGRLVVEFTDEGELLSCLYSLAQRIAADYAGFLAALKLPPGSSPTPRPETGPIQPVAPLLSIATDTR